MTEGERIKYLRKELLHMTGEEFCKPLGVQRTAITRIEGGSNGLTDQMLLLICRSYCVSEKWLRTGEGEPFKPQTKNNYISEWVTRVLADQDDDIKKKFIYALTNVSDEGWEMIAKFVADLTAQAEEQTDPVNPDK